MNVLDSFQAFVDWIEKDLNCNDFNPIRFINVDTMPTWIKAKSYLGNKVIETLKLSDFCATDDIAPNLNQLKKTLRHKKTSTLVIPLSEYLRINDPIAKKTLDDLLHLKYESFDIGKSRIYVLLYRMKDLLMGIDLSPKELKTVLAIQETMESDYALTIVQNNIDFYNCGNDINGLKKYFIYWEQNPDKPIVLHTQNAITYSDIVFSDNVEVIVSAFGLLRHFGMPHFITEDMGTEEQWLFMQGILAESKDVEFSLSKHFGNVKYSDDLFNNWRKYSNNDQWLIWLWSHFYTTNLYLKRIFHTNGSFINFEIDIIRSIADYISDSYYNRLYEERKKLLISMQIVITKEDIIKYFTFDAAIERLRLLTDCSKDERTSIISCISEIKKSELYMPIVEVTYPALYNYLQPISFEDDVLSEYFQLYRFSKVQDYADDILLEMVNENANNKCKNIFELPSRNMVLESEYTSNSIVYFVDAFGAEYISLFSSFFDTSKYEVSIRFSHCNLPAVTNINNDFYEDKIHLEPYYELDRWKHSNCIYPTSIEHELTLIQEIASNVLEKLQEKKYEKVIVVADHGTSRFAVKNRGNSYVLNETSVPYKFGRYCHDECTGYSEINGCVQQDDYWIFANYERFVQKGAPINEIHGGASIEEMVVPVITIMPFNEKKEDYFFVKLLLDTYKLPVNRSINVQFAIEPIAQNVEVSVNGKKYSCKNEGNKYTFDQKIIDKREQYVAKVISNGKIIGEITYKIEHPVMRNDKFDI